MGAALPGARAPYRLPLQRVGVQYMSAEWAPEAGARRPGESAGGGKRRSGRRFGSWARARVLLYGQRFPGKRVEAGARWGRCLGRQPLACHRIEPRRVRCR